MFAEMCGVMTRLHSQNTTIQPFYPTPLPYYRPKLLESILDPFTET